MTTPASPNPIYHDTTKGRNRSRHNSTRKSFASGSGSYLDSPRTLCPRDTDTFNYNSAHLATWSAPLHLLDKFPQDLKAALTTVQHSGAAVLTGFERLEKHSPRSVNASSAEGLDDHDLPPLVKLPSPKLSIPSETSSAGSSDLTSPVSMDSSFLGSPVFSSSQSMSSVSPICLAPSDSYMFEKREEPRERSFTTPVEPNESYYRTELSYLRTEAIPHLRHASLKVNTEWNEIKRLGDLSADEVGDFEMWWFSKKAKINQLFEQVNRLSDSIGLTPTGLGWTAP